MAPPEDKKSSALKAPATKVETINLKVLIHCQGCKRKVKKILSEIEGVESVDIDANLGKATVIGIVDSKVLLKKLEKKGKVAEVLNVSGSKGKVAEVLSANVSGSKGKVAEVLSANGGKGKDQQNDQSKVDQNKKPKKVRFAEVEGDKKSKVGGGDGASANSEGGKKSNINGSSNGAAHTGQDEKKKKGGDDGSDEWGPSYNTTHKNVMPRMIETGFSKEPADYATHIFSDENTDSCCIM